MPLNKEHKILFLHVPKTGGTTIESLLCMTELENLCSYRWNVEQFDFIEKHKHLSTSYKIHYEPQHYTIDTIKALVPDYQSYFKFVFVRNPYTRILSEYFWSTGLKIKEYSEFNPNEFHNWCSLFLGTIDLSHKEPQVKYFDHTINFIGKYEKFSRDFHLLKSKLALFSKEYIKLKDIEIPQLNQTNLDKELLVKSILPETKKLIYSIYQSDFRMFGYDSLRDQ
jgi:chondroitin 4-sulfotransferase 11